MADMIEGVEAKETAEAPEAKETEVQEAPEKNAVDEFTNALMGEPKEPAKEAEETAPSIPEKYEFNLPDGLTLTPEIESRFTELARGMNLTQEQASGLIKLHSDIMMDAMSQAEKTKSEWVNICQKEGLSSAENMRGVRMVFDAFDESGAARKAAIESGIIYNPDIMRMFVAMGNVLKEDSAPDSHHAAVATGGADILFSNSKYN